MSTFKDRLLEERNQLDERITKLDAFIISEKFQTVTEVQQSLLIIQLHAMKAYTMCLNERLGWLEKEAVEA